MGYCLGVNNPFGYCLSLTLIITIFWVHIVCNIGCRLNLSISSRQQKSLWLWGIWTWVLGMHTMHRICVKPFLPIHGLAVSLIPAPCCSLCIGLNWPGVDTGFLERGLICSKVYGFALLILSHFPKYSMKMRPNHSIFMGYLKTGDREGVQVNPLNPSGSATAGYVNKFKSLARLCSWAFYICLTLLQTPADRFLTTRPN